MAEKTPLVWAVHDGKPGMASQAMGLAEALGFPMIEKRIAIRAPWRYLPPQLWLTPLAALGPNGDPLEPPWPDVLVGCGRNTVAPALAAKRRSGGRIFWAQVQNPNFARGEINLVVAPRHDGAGGANVLTTLGAVHRVTPEKLERGARKFAGLFATLKRPLVAVLLGGDNKAYRVTETGIAVFASQLAALIEKYGLAITPSRRTAPDLIAKLRSTLGNRAYIWDGIGDNPYFGLLGAADAIIVTADSVSMVSEAAATGKPVHIVDFAGGSAKFDRFHATMREAGITRPFTGAVETWNYQPPDDTALAATEIRRRMAAKAR